MDIQATNVFKRNWQSKKRYVINRGGTRSSKTYSLGQICALRLYTGQIQEGGKEYKTGILSVVRKHSTTIRGTAMRDFEDIIDSMDIRELIDINKTEKTYKYHGRVVEFFGADNQQKLRWWSRDILYCNEANELIRDQEFFQLMIRTKDKIFIDFNPDNEEVWINQELEIKRQSEVWDVEIIVSTYKDNKFLPEQQVKEIERLATINPQYWKIYWLWEYGRLEGVVFQNWTTIPKLPEDIKLLCYGMDFWYSNDPTSLIALYKQWDDLILDELIYKTWLTNQDIVKHYESLSISKYEEIYADSSEPKSIEEIFRSWYNIKPVTKWADSIVYGIDTMMQYNIKITSRSTNLIKEFKSYTRWKDKNWKLTKKPIDILNHWIDAARYGAMMTLWKQKEVNIYFL